MIWHGMIQLSKKHIFLKFIFYLMQIRQLLKPAFAPVSTKSNYIENDKCEESEAMCKALEDFYNDGVEEGKSIGKEEGRTEGKAEGKAEIVASVRKMHLRGFGAEEIADLLDQGQRIIEQILNLITDNPEADNLQIAKKLLEKEGVA